MTTLIDRMEQLRDLGVEIGTDDYYRGRVGHGRASYELPDKPTGVVFPFTPTEWISICMREPPGGIESLYVGGCCGNMGVVQDTMAGVFRDGGYAKIDDLTTMGHYLRGHDGYEPFAGEFDLDAALEPERWAQPPEGKVWNYLYQEEGDALPAHFDPWSKVCVIHAALEPALRLEKTYTPHVESPRNKDEEGALELRRLYNGLAQIEWSDLFGYHNDHGNRDSEVARLVRDRDETRLANRKLALAKLLDPARKFVARLESIEEPFEGFGLVKPGTDEVLENRAGMCLFPTREAAERLVELWERTAREDAESKARHEKDRADDEWDGGLSEADVAERYEAPEAEIVPVRVTIADGLQVLR